MLINALKLIVAPRRAWQALADQDASAARVLLMHTIPLAVIPAVAWYFGVTRQGWDVAGQVVYLTPGSALPMCVLFYLAMIAGVLFLGYMVHWMAGTYESESRFSRSVALVSLTATPFFLSGIMGFYPVLWLDILLGVGVACYCIYLLYAGTPTMLHIPAERGFLYASAVFAVALVSFVALLGVTVVLWEYGPTPTYAY